MIKNFPTSVCGNRPDMRDTGKGPSSSAYYRSTQQESVGFLFSLDSQTHLSRGFVCWYKVTKFQVSHMYRFKSIVILPSFLSFLPKLPPPSSFLSFFIFTKTYFQFIITSLVLNQINNSARVSILKSTETAVSNTHIFKCQNCPYTLQQRALYRKSWKP